jgi:alkaline phosphatase D
MRISMTRSISSLLPFCFAAAWAAAHAARASPPPPLVVPDAGPMIGHVTDNSARIWMQFPIAGDVTINTYDVARGTAVSGVRVGLEGPSPFVCDIPISGLQPNRAYRIEVKFDGEPVRLPGPEIAIRTTPARGEESIFNIAFGGGIAVTPLERAQTSPAAPKPVPAAHKLPIFSAVSAAKPRAFLFLGNTGYLPAKSDDFPVTHRAAYRFIADFHSAIRREPDLQDLFRATPCYSTFGDRDFGPTDFAFAQESLIAFQRFWPNPDWGTPANPGCFSTFSYGDVDFFLLDTRTFRSAPDASDPCLLGEAQMAWLQKNLKASRASFKILAAPSMLWGDDPDKPDRNSWSSFPAERKAFFKWVGENRVNGIVGLSAGNAIGQLTTFESADVGYPLFSLGSSSLSADPAAPPVPAPIPDPRRVGQPVAGESFGTLDFGAQREHRFVTLRLRDAAGKTRVEQTLLAVTLRH